MSFNGLRTIKFITITEPQAFHTTFLHVYRFYYSSDGMVSLPSLWIIYKERSAIFLKQYPLVFTYNWSKIPVPAFNLYKNIISRVKYTGERRRDNMQVNIAFWMHCQLVNFYFVHISNYACVMQGMPILSCCSFTMNRVALKSSYQVIICMPKENPTWVTV